MKSVLSGPGRLHDLFVTHEAMSPGEWKAGGEGLTITYGFPPLPIRHGAGDDDDARTRRPCARRCRQGTRGAERHARALAESTLRGRFRRYCRHRTAHLRSRLVAQGSAFTRRVSGTDFEVRVWEKLLAIPMGKLTTYSDLAARSGSPKAARAVGAAVGKNPICFVVPCHRVIGKDGDVTGYHWGIARTPLGSGNGGGVRGYSFFQKIVVSQKPPAGHIP